MDRYEKLLEVYTLEQLLELIDLEPVAVLAILDELGYLPEEIVEPL